MARLNWKYFYYPQNPRSLQFLPQTGHHTCYGSQHTQIGALSLGFSQLCSQVFIIFEPGPRLIQRHSLNGLGPITALALIRIASSDQVQRQQQRDEPVRENTHLVLDTLASRLRSCHLIVGVESLVFLGHKDPVYIHPEYCLYEWMKLSVKGERVPGKSP